MQPNQTSETKPCAVFDIMIRFVAWKGFVVYHKAGVEAADSSTAAAGA
jgi:hypothetical protein